MRMSEGEVRDEMNWIDLLPPIRSRPSNDYPSPAVIVGEPAATRIGTLPETDICMHHTG